MNISAHNQFDELFKGGTQAVLANFERITELNPDHLSAHVLQGAIHDYLGNRAAADVAYEAAITIDPVRGEEASSFGRSELGAILLGPPLTGEASPR